MDKGKEVKDLRKGRAYCQKCSKVYKTADKEIIVYGMCLRCKIKMGV